MIENIHLRNRMNQAQIDEMIKQKKEYDKWKKKEGDSDLMFNEKDSKKKDKN